MDNTYKCSRCGYVKPTLSKVCPNCGHTETGESSVKVSAEDLLNQMEQLVRKMKTIGNPSLGGVTGGLMWIVYLVLALLCIIAGIIAEETMMWIISLVFILLFVVSLNRRMRGKTRNAKNTSVFRAFTADFEALRSQCLMYFREDEEIRRQVNRMSTEISDLKITRHAASLRQHLTAIIILFASLFAVGYLVIDIALYSAGEQIEIPNQPVRAIDKCLSEGNSDEAVNIFLLEYIGEDGDYEQAKKIVIWMIKNNRKAEAKGFADRCSSLRYSSDLDKLKDLINR